MTECIENNTLYHDKDGYPKAKYRGKLQPVSRIVMGLLFGFESIKGKFICHTCGNRSCLNPQHLYIGNPQTNSDDKFTDGTMPMGDRHPNWRNDVDTDVMVDMYNSGYTQQSIADYYGMSQSAVSSRIRKKAVGDTD